MKLPIKSALVAAVMALCAGTAYAAPDYCGPDGTYTDTATDPDSVLTVGEVTLGGTPSDDCYGVVLDPQVDVSALWDGGWTGEATSGGGTFELDGVTYAVTATIGTTGDWELSLTGDPGETTIDFIVVLKASDRWAAYFFDDWTFTVPAEEDGTYHISYVNNGSQVPNLSHLSFFARLGDSPEEPPEQVAEPGSLLLLGLGLAGLAVVQRRRRRI